MKKKVALLLINIEMESRNAKYNLSNTELFLFISLLFLMCFSELQFCLRLFIQTFDIREICRVFCQTECSSEVFTNIGVQCGLCVICQMSVLLLGKLSLGIEELWLQQRAWVLWSQQIWSRKSLWTMEGLGKCTCVTTKHWVRWCWRRSTPDPRATGEWPAPDHCTTFMMLH